MWLPCLEAKGQVCSRLHVSAQISTPKARFDAGNEATSQQSILLTINQVDLLMSLIKIILKTKTFI